MYKLKNIIQTIIVVPILGFLFYLNYLDMECKSKIKIENEKYIGDTITINDSNYVIGSYSVYSREFMFKNGMSINQKFITKESEYVR